MIPVGWVILIGLVAFYGGAFFFALVAAHDSDWRDSDDVQVTCPVCRSTSQLSVFAVEEKA